MNEMTLQEAFDLGQAVAHFYMGEVNAGLHYITPIYDREQDETVNQVFQTLCNELVIVDIAMDESTVAQIGEAYMEQVIDWCEDNEVPLYGYEGQPQNQEEQDEQE